jgi:integrase
MLLIGLYSGTRPGAILRLRWLPSTDAGWIDLDKGVLHRRGSLSPRSNKRQPPARIHRRLLIHLKRWQREDAQYGLTQVVHYAGRSVKNVDGAWAAVRRLADHEHKDGPHILRHSSATMYMSWGLKIAEIAGFLGMSQKTLIEVYGHHHPNFQEEIAKSAPPRNRGVLSGGKAGG